MCEVNPREHFLAEAKVLAAYLTFYATSAIWIMQYVAHGKKSLSRLNLQFVSGRDW